VLNLTLSIFPSFFYTGLVRLTDVSTIYGGTVQLLAVDICTGLGLDSPFFLFAVTVLKWRPLVSLSILFVFSRFFPVLALFPSHPHVPLFYGAAPVVYLQYTRQPITADKVVALGFLLGQVSV